MKNFLLKNRICRIITADWWHESATNPY